MSDAQVILLRHLCVRQHASTESVLACHFPAMTVESGDGSYFVLGCGGRDDTPPIAVRATEAEADAVRRTYDEQGCGARLCSRHHRVRRIER